MKKFSTTTLIRVILVVILITVFLLGEAGYITSGVTSLLIILLSTVAQFLHVWKTYKQYGEVNINVLFSIAMGLFVLRVISYMVL